ncbi:MAG: hypothetical protein HQL44_14580 [Alphaproteobacteria bacterium]|nr:hypothetical protein [Alphaproteobacteria bacterium]
MADPTTIDLNANNAELQRAAWTAMDQTYGQSEVLQGKMGSESLLSHRVC